MPLLAKWRYDVKQTTPLEQPVNIASSANLFQLRNDMNYHARPSDSIF